MSGEREREKREIEGIDYSQTKLETDVRGRVRARYVV